MALQGESFIARRTESVDAEKIEKLVNRHTETVFGRVDVQNIIEHANLSITLVGVDSDEVLGHMALFDYPNLKLADPAVWETWLHENYQCKKATPLNSLFVHLFVAKDGFSQGANAELLRATFMAVPHLQFVFLSTPSGTNLGSALASQMSIVFSNNEDPATDVYMTERFEHFPMLHIRPAKVEDADDLMPIFTQYSSEVSQQYGEFFLAELIESQDESHKTFVADVGGHAIGFLSVTTQVDVDLLNSCYQLEPFHGLKRPVEEDEIRSITTLGTEQDIYAAVLDQTSSKSIATASAGKMAGTTSSISSEQSVKVSMREGSQQSLNPHTVATSPHHSSVKSLGRSEGEGEESGSGGKDPEAVSSVSMASRRSVTIMSDSGQPVAEKEQKSSSELGSHSSISKPELAAKDPHPQTEGTRPSQDPAEETPVSSAGQRKRPRKKHYVFKGACNALAVQLFAIDDKYETRSMDLLPSVFRLFPDYDFLILSQPHSFPEFPLLGNFTRVPPRVSASVSQELYVLHKCGLLHSFSVSRVKPDDVPQIEKLSADLSGSPELMEDIQRYVQARRDPLNEGGTPISALVARCANQVVGVAVLRQEEEMRYIRSHYNIEDFIYFDYHLNTEHAHLHHFMLNPIFASYAKHFIKECLRLSYKSCLYYPLTAADPMTDQYGRPHSIITALSHMIPIRPRRQIVYSMEQVGANAPLEEVLQEKPPFALYHTNRKLTLEPRITVNSRVVVVGASDTAFAFLESLAFCPHLYFTNITLVSPHPFHLPSGHTPSEGGEVAPSSSTSSFLPRWPNMVASSLCFTQKQESLLGLGTWVNVARQKMVAINRPSQFIVVESGEGQSLLHYDYLILCTGTQYQVPRLSIAKTKPSNVFTINNEHDTTSLLQWVKDTMPSNPKGDLVIYGNNLDAYGILQALLDCGVPPFKVLLARPDAEPLSSNPQIQEHIDRGLRECGAKVWDSITLKGWVVDEEGKLTELRMLVSNKSDFELSCHGLIYVDQKSVDMRAFKAMNDACLVFDERLVITTNHATNDPLIFAAGPVTKYSRRYRADKWTHACYNSYEVGQRLALTMLTKLDPTAEPWTDPTHDLDPDLLPTYTSYKAVTVCLPGGYHYLHVHSPRPQGQERALHSEGHDLSTDTTDNGCMYLHLNKYSCVDEIMAMSHKPLKETDNYLCLYKLHERYLNNMLSRYEGGLIPDFYVYFRQSWACAIFHDRFGDFMEEIKEQLSTVAVKDEESLVEHMQGLLHDDPHLTVAKFRPYLSAIFDNSTCKSFVEKKLFKFLQYNAQHLPMYAKPDMI